MRARRLLLPILVSSVATLACAPALAAQTSLMRVTVPSPTAASLGKFGDVPVNLYTGVPDISVPLFTVQGRTLELPVTLRYHGGGIRVEEIASWVGLGWALDAGGVITRSVRGLPDDYYKGYYYTGYNWYNAGTWPYPSSNIIAFVLQKEWDPEPDRFFFSFAGRSGQFVMGPTTADRNVREVRTIPHQRLRIVPIIPSGGDLARWEITTEDGTQYIFAASELTMDNSATLIDPRPTNITPDTKPSFKSSWYLTEIRSPGGDTIKLYYSTYTVRHRVGGYEESFHYRPPPPAEQCVPNSVEMTYDYTTHAQRLDSITSAIYTVRFTSSLRSDALSPTGAPQEYRLDRITIAKRDGRIIRSFRLEYDHFQGNRLRLKAVYEEDRDGNSLPPYTFTYNQTPLPPTNSYAQDHWGYYNGKTSNTTLIPPGITPEGVQLSGADRTPDPNFMQAGILKRIEYPTGGSTEFVFEPNDYGEIAPGGRIDGAIEGPGPVNRRMAGGLRVALIRDVDGVGNATVRRYRYTLESDTTWSSGVIMATPVYSYSHSDYICSFYSRSSISRLPLGEGPIVGYSEVTVLHGANGEYGRSRYMFHTAVDAPDGPYPEYWPFAPRTSYEWMRGHQTGVWEYDASGNLQRLVQTTYRFRESPSDSAKAFRALSVNVLASSSFGPTFQHHAYQIISAWKHPETEIWFHYNDSGWGVFTTEKGYEYGNPAHLQVTVITETNSDGAQRVTRMKYPADYGSGSGDGMAQALTAMKGSAHMHSPVIERWVVERRGTSEAVVEAELQTYRKYTDGRILPHQRFILSSPQPVQ